MIYLGKWEWPLCNVGMPFRGLPWGRLLKSKSMPGSNIILHVRIQNKAKMLFAYKYLLIRNVDWSQGTLGTNGIRSKISWPKTFQRKQLSSVHNARISSVVLESQLRKCNAHSQSVKHIFVSNVEISGNREKMIVSARPATG